MRKNFLKDLLEPYALEAAKKEANSFPPAELVQLLMDIEPDKRVLAFRLLEKDKAARVSVPHSLILDVLEGNALAVMTGDRTSEAIRLLGEANLLAIAVVDSEGRLVGDIAFDDVIDLVEEEADETALSQAGVINLLARDEAWSDVLVKGTAFSAVGPALILL